ncbi:hypothetical protein NDU88_008926 [Pleurodeles waltl]|uniref:Uncharacterized protein n=1 Tax=Pleurodeles waltl TaxID=8319 RepID=A0AAV7QT80_PLEWA|nr:hypothetical protein NDU88_008926 [Pleurodeles waltl]
MECTAQPEQLHKQTRLPSGPARGARVSASGRHMVGCVGRRKRASVLLCQYSPCRHPRVSTATTFKLTFVFFFRAGSLDLI